MTSLQSLSKKELVERASLLPHFKKSLAREKKEVLVQFLMTAIATATATATGATIPSSSTVITPTENALPPLATSTSTSLEKKKTASSLSRMSKAELFEASSKKDGFDKDKHGKTKATLLEFLKGLLPTDTKPKDTKPKDTKPKDTKPKDTKPKDTKPKDTKPKDTQQQDQVQEEDGIDPVNVGSLLDTPDDVEAIKSAILRLLMDTAPFQSDPELKAKLDKIV